MDFSVGVNAAWRIAADEAEDENCQYIEKKHVLIAIFALRRMLRNIMQAPEGVQRKFDAEIQAVDDVLSAFELDRRQLWSKVQSKLGVGSGERPWGVTHRSEACKKLFRRGEELAALSGARVMTCLPLLAAILEEPGDVISSVLHEAGVKAEDLRERALTLAANRRELLPQPKQMHGF